MESRHWTEEQFPPLMRLELKGIGWTKGIERAKLARKRGDRFDRASWLHKARGIKKETFGGKLKRRLPALDRRTTFK